MGISKALNSLVKLRGSVKSKLVVKVKMKKRLTEMVSCAG
jgi:hypothetical protein